MQRRGEERGSAHFADEHRRPDHRRDAKARRRGATDEHGYGMPSTSPEHPCRINTTAQSNGISVAADLRVGRCKPETEGSAERSHVAGRQENEQGPEHGSGIITATGGPHRRSSAVSFSPCLGVLAVSFPSALIGVHRRLPFLGVSGDSMATFFLESVPSV